ncbi:MAG TPA: mobile mystery protein A [Cryomorphaceae bacterium]|jgi:predicted DNA-binding mobile mystery protein A|nr:mobile mystery protein A [Cryomorphaceae bacterium]
MKKRQLQISQLESKIKLLTPLLNQPSPPSGWIKALRTSFGMTMEQLAKKIGVSKQNISRIEKREQEGALTIAKLREVAAAMDMQLVYGLVPKEKSLDAYIDRKARELAKQIISRTSNTMKLEDQENSEERIQKAIEERVAEIKRELPKSLWD